MRHISFKIGAKNEDFYELHVGTTGILSIVNVYTATYDDTEHFSRRGKGVISVILLYKFNKFELGPDLPPPLEPHPRSAHVAKIKM